MVLYNGESGSDTGSVAYAEQQMEGVRQRKEAVAEEEENFSRGIVLADFAVQGANALLNSRANELERNQAFKRAAYRATNRRVEEYRQITNALKQSELSDQEYLTQKYHNLYLAKFDANYENADKASVNFVLQNLAREQAIKNAPEFRRVLDLAEEFPEYGEEFDEYYTSFNKSPRNIGEFILKTGGDAFSRESSETLEYKNNKARDAFYGTEEMQRYSNIREAFQALDANGANVSGIMDEITKAIEDGRIKGELGDVALRTEVVQQGGMAVERTMPYQIRSGLAGEPDTLETVTGINPWVSEISSLGLSDAELGLPSLVSVTEMNNILPRLSDDGKDTYLNRINQLRDGKSLTTDQYLQAVAELATNPNNWVIDTTTQKGMLDVAQLHYQATLGTMFAQQKGPDDKIINEPMYQEREQPTDPLVPKPEYEGILAARGVSLNDSIRIVSSERDWIMNFEGREELDYIAQMYHFQNGFNDLSLMQRFETGATGSTIIDNKAVEDFDKIRSQILSVDSEFYKIFKNQIEDDRNRYTADNLSNEVYNGVLDQRDITLLDSVSGEVFKNILIDMGIEYITNDKAYEDLFSVNNIISLKFNLKARKLYIKEDKN